MNGSVHALLALALTALCCAAALASPRGLPTPRSGRPGNVFLHGDAIEIASPDPQVAWTMVDYAGQRWVTVPAGMARIRLGKLPVGFYRLQREGGDWVSLAVLEPLKAVTPATSPICVDVAMAWFYDAARMDDVASLCALAGVNRVRDRLTWGAMEPERGRWAGPTQYDASAKAQAGAGLEVLQVHHGSPAWANPDGKRFPLDLRDAYRFQREMARRWEGQVTAFEPWNEADIEGFGGHTGAEMAALQKASYLGLKAGNPDVTACLNVFALHQRAQLEDLAANEAWPYFDTYNLHHYEWITGYPRLYADHRAVSAGRPLWVTECAMPVRWAGDPGRQEPSDDDLREQSERLPKVFAGSLHEGSAATFYFILGHYAEGPTQFGIVRRDLTPRPAYVALAAAGRLLADARPLGRVKAADTVHAYAFRARPDGVPRTVVVAWASEGTAQLALGVTPSGAFDHLGRPMEVGRAMALTTAPRYLLLPRGASAARLNLVAPPARPRRPRGTPSQVVLHAAWPAESKVLQLSAHRIPAAGPASATLAVYNFGSQAVSGKLAVSGPQGWGVSAPAMVTVEPGGRAELPLTVDARGLSTRLAERITVRGDFGAAGKPVACFNVAPEGNALSSRQGAPVPGAEDPARWTTMTSGGPMTITGVEGGIEVQAQPTGDDRWVYPVLRLPAGGIPAGVDGLAFDLEMLEGSALIRAIFDEAGGSSYVADAAVQPAGQARVRTVALLDAAIHGAGWSKPDANGRLDPDQVATIKVGGNTASGTLRYRITNLRWVKR